MLALCEVQDFIALVVIVAPLDVAVNFDKGERNVVAHFALDTFDVDDCA